MFPFNTVLTENLYSVKIDLHFLKSFIYFRKIL